MSLPDGAIQVFAERARFSTLDPSGFVAAGSAVFTTDELIKATFTPNMETGVDLAQINANGDLIAHYKHGDMPKYYEVSLQVATNDPILHAMLTGGTVLTDTSTQLSAPSAATLTAYTTLGTLAASTYGYTITAYNEYGETTVSPEVTQATTGSTGAVLVTLPTFPAGATGLIVYGRTPGGEQKMKLIPAIGSQTTSAASGTGSPTTLAVTALTDPIPSGYQFTIAGDTNAPHIVFTTTSAAGVGATTLFVSVSQAITTTIAAGAIQPVFFDTGSLTPLGRPPTSNTTAGPGNDVGWQAPSLGVVGNPNGIGIELWARMILNGTDASYLPFNRWVIPGVRNLREDARGFEAAMQLPTYLGQAFENPNWGSGPTGDWQFDSSKWGQYARAGADTLPAVGLSTAPATF